MAIGPQDGGADPQWHPASVPGTAAAALRTLGLATDERLASLAHTDVWFHTIVPPGNWTLRFDGLATDCEIWLGDERIGESRNMFLAQAFEIAPAEPTTLQLHFRPISAERGIPSRRQRWRPHLVDGAHLRLWRTSLLGHMPGWCPPVVPVGPYQPVTLLGKSPVAARDVRLRATVEKNLAHLDVSLTLEGASAPPVLHCGGHSMQMMRTGTGYTARLALPDLALWWPHTHGEPALHAVWITVGDTRLDLGRSGFRALALDRGADGHGFALHLNGVPLFCRGANWTPPDVLALSATPQALRERLELARDAGMNMLRISGIMTHETPDFFDLCDELGILVWQDMMLANFDYDLSDTSVGGEVLRECVAFLDRTENAPSLAVVCGGSEILQQAAMLSLPETIWRDIFWDTTFPATVSQHRPDVIVAPNSPFGGDLPFRTDAGVSHYFGVGAYGRPLEDARRARVRFASECLAFAHLPQPETLVHQSGGALPGSPEWQSRIVRDLKADWTFEDTRDRYLGLLYDVDAARLKAEVPERYLALSSAVPGEVMETAFAEWRRQGSDTAGALVWLLGDVMPGFGWGVIDSEGRQKPAYFALKRAFRSQTVLLTDEGLNGLGVHVINESPTPRRYRLTLAAYDGDGHVVIDGARTLELAARSTEALSSTELFGVFFDVTAAYRFGPAPHVVSVARLEDAATGARLAEAFHFPLGRAAAMAPAIVTAITGRDAEGWWLDVAADRFAQSVHVDAPGFLPEEDWFHLAPGHTRRLRLAGRGEPQVRVRALNAQA